MNGIVNQLLSAAGLFPVNVEPSRGYFIVDGVNRKLNANNTTNLEKRLESWALIPVPSELHHRCIGEKETSAAYSFQYFSNQILDAKCNKQKEKISCKMMLEENRNDGAVQDQVLDKVVADISQENSRGCVTLNKLRDILGTVSSPNKHCIDSQDLSVAWKSLHPETKDDTHTILKEQRALNRKLLSQAEDAIGNKLIDAETRTEKMWQLKKILAGVRRDGVFI
ncbi:hypothetical protein Leryth_005594 [Lithospermum erythrorhizon]|nr:hypothetical protein Leryth_005594 [Lithospermum erythrorhizon]